MAQIAGGEFFCKFITRLYSRRYSISHLSLSVCFQVMHADIAFLLYEVVCICLSVKILQTTDPIKYILRNPHKGPG